MQGHLSTALRASVRRTLRRLGLDVRRYTSTANVAWRRATILARSGVTHVLDVGANVGQYGAELRAAGYIGKISSFEPLAGPFASLARRAARDGRWRCYNYALSHNNGKAEINVSSNSVSSSLLPITTSSTIAAPDSAYVGTEVVSVCTLDSLAETLLDPEDVVFLKADVQGTELDVLRGTDATLARIRGLELELSIVELYAGQPLLWDVAAYVEARGFLLVSLESGFADPGTGHVLQVDGIFIRP